MSKSEIKRFNIVRDELHHYTSDCMKCGGRVLTNEEETKDFPCECAYPGDCPIKKLQVKDE